MVGAHIAAPACARYFKKVFPVLESMLFPLGHLRDTVCFLLCFRKKRCVLTGEIRISAQHEVVMMQLAFRFPTKVETRQLIPGQWKDHIKWSPLTWLESDAIFRERKRDPTISRLLVWVRGGDVVN